MDKKSGILEVSRVRLGPRLFISITVGLAFAFLTWVMIGDHSDGHATGIGFQFLGEISVILLLPGIVASAMISDNVHIFSTGIAVLGNFVFYFSVVYVTLTRRKSVGTGAV